MLCLSRKKGESIVIAGNVVVTILRNSHGQVKLGIDAPREISVLRSEVEPAGSQEK